MRTLKELVVLEEAKALLESGAFAPGKGGRLAQGADCCSVAFLTTGGVPFAFLGCSFSTIFFSFSTLRFPFRAGALGLFLASRSSRSLRIRSNSSSVYPPRVI